MSSPHTIEQQKTFERLAGVLSLQGWKDCEVSLDSDELRIELHGGRAACNVVMIPHEPIFQAHFVFATSFVHAVSFTIGPHPDPRTLPGQAKSFLAIDEAARWLLQFLRTQQV